MTTNFGTLYIFKNYFATVFSVSSKISCIQTDLKCLFGKIIFANLFYYSDYFCCHSWVPLHFLVLFMSFTILFQLIFIFIYSTFSKKFQFQQNKRIPNRPSETFLSLFLVLEQVKGWCLTSNPVLLESQVSLLRIGVYISSFTC